MPYQKSETVELKSVVVDDIKEEIIAFANSDGGTLYIGVRDNGEIVGEMIRTAPHCKSATWSGIPSSRMSPCFFTTRPLMMRERKLLRSMSSVAQTVRTISRKRECARRVSMSGKAIPLFRLLTLQFVA